MTDAKERLTNLNARFGAYHRADRATLTAFRSLTEAAMRDGTVLPAMKELTALAIAVAKGCDDCIVYHAAAAIKHGATRDEAIEMLAIAVEMGGGPGAVYATKALQTFDELST